MPNKFTEEQIKFVSSVLQTNKWVSWNQLVAKFPDLANDALGAMYKPMISFRHLPPVPGEAINTGIAAAMRLPTGYQDVVMSRPLNPDAFTIEKGLLDAVSLVIDAIRDFHSVSTYIMQSGMVV